MEKDGRVLWANSTQTSILAQEDGFWDVRQRRPASNSWLSLSVCPLVCGWYPDVRLTDAPRSWQKAFQNRATNWGPQSERTFLGNP